MRKPIVLIVEDEDDIREFERFILEDAGYYVLTASDGERALQILDGVVPALVVTDLSMPIVDGSELFRAMRSIFSLQSVPVLFTTALPGQVPRGVPVLTKPYRPIALLDMVLRLAPLPRASTRDDQLREELLAMADTSALVMLPLVQWIFEQDGDGAMTRMRHVHDGNRFREIIQRRGWPTRRLVGSDGATAAWRIVHQDLTDPALLRLCLPLLTDAARRHEASLQHVAMLTDRIRFFEGSAQLYGTQYGWGIGGEVQPFPVENAGALDHRRRNMGLIPIVTNTTRMRRRLRRDGWRSPRDVSGRRRALVEWAERIGWRGATTRLIDRERTERMYVR